MAHTDTLIHVDSTFTVETRFRAMGNTAHVLVVAGDGEHAAGLVERARTWAASLENAWSRFIPTSDVYRLNTARGRAVQIRPDTEVLVRHLLAAFEATDGLFDPFVLPSLVEAGYASSLAGDGAAGCAVPATGPPSAANVMIETVDGAAWCRLMDGASIDPGGLGKGLAADIIAERLVIEGATGALVSMGGDVRCVGKSPDERGWAIDLETLTHPSFGPTTVVLRSGAVATSSTFAKRWHRGHHIIDPATRRPLDETTPAALRMASVIASTAVWAEVFATASLVAGADTAGLIVESNGLAARFERADGRPLATTSFERYCS